MKIQEQEIERIRKDFEDLQVFTEDDRNKFIERYKKVADFYDKSLTIPYLAAGAGAFFTTLAASLLACKNLGIPHQLGLIIPGGLVALVGFYPTAKVSKYENYARRVHITADLHRVSVNRGDVEEAKEKLEQQYDLANIFREVSFEEFRERYSLGELVRRFPC